MAPARRESPLLTFSLVALLWQGDLGEQRLCLVSPDQVLVPKGTRLCARSAADGNASFQYDFEEARGPLRVPCRIQGAQLLRQGPLTLPGLPPAPERPGGAPAAVCVAGDSEIHGLSLPSGRVLWKATKCDGCILTLHEVGDVDGDGADDVVSCGCNVTECFSGTTGAVLWQCPVSGRSLWAGACGDLDGDGLAEVLVQAGRSLEVMSVPRRGEVKALFQVEGFLPRASIPRQKAFLAVFGGASAWLWEGSGKGRKVWEAAEALLDAGSWGDVVALATRKGIWAESPAGGWVKKVDREIRAAAIAKGKVFLVDAESDLFQLCREQGALEKIHSFSAQVDGLSTDRDGTILCALSGGKCFVYRLSAPRSP